MKKTTAVKQSLFNSVKLLLALGLFLGLCLLMILTRSAYSQSQQSLFLFFYAVIWAVACMVRVRYVQNKKVREDGTIKK